MDIQKVISNLKRRGFLPAYFDNSQDACKYILDLIPASQSVGIGGSMTVSGLSLDKKLQDKGVTVYSHSLVAPELKDKVYQLAGSADWYMSSTNALTEDGDFVNIDGSANRISALCFGVKKVVYVLGVNKITPDLESAIARVRNVAAPLNTKRLGKNTPCATSGECCYCDSPDCICNATLISHHPTKFQQQVHVVIINENLGY